VKNQLDGTMLLEDLEHAIRPVGDDHLPLTQLLCLENTHNRMGGRILTTEYVNTVGELAKKHKLALHMDGARLLNATVGLGVDPAVAVAACDSVSLCLSKGLGAPIGSVIVGTSDFIRRARRLRKALGGGLRQVGILAAAGLIAVNEMVKGLAGDHARVLKIAEGLRTIPGFIVPAAETVQTNILYVKLDQSKFPCTAAEFTAGLRAAGLLISATDTHTVRFVTYHQIDDEAVQRTLVIMQEVAGRMTNKQ
jgi:threonine aldolase